MLVFFIRNTVNVMKALRCPPPHPFHPPIDIYKPQCNHQVCVCVGGGGGAALGRNVVAVCVCSSIYVCVFAADTFLIENFLPFKQAETIKGSLKAVDSLTCWDALPLCAHAPRLLSVLLFPLLVSC